MDIHPLATGEALSDGVEDRADDTLGLGLGLGLSLSLLVVGTAFPHLLKGLGAALPWAAVLAGVSVCAALGGLAMYAGVRTVRT